MNARTSSCVQDASGSIRMSLPSSATRGAGARQSPLARLQPLPIRRFCTEMRALTEAETAKLQKGLEGSRLRAPVFLATTTG